MNTVYECARCEQRKSLADLRQVEREETCLYVCRTCGAEEGVWLRVVDNDAQQSQA